MKPRRCAPTSPAARVSAAPVRPAPESKPAFSLRQCVQARRRLLGRPSSSASRPSRPPRILAVIRHSVLRGRRSATRDRRCRASRLAAAGAPTVAKLQPCRSIAAGSSWYALPHRSSALVLRGHAAAVAAPRPAVAAKLSVAVAPAGHRQPPVRPRYGRSHVPCRGRSIARAAA